MTVVDPSNTRSKTLGRRPRARRWDPILVKGFRACSADRDFLGLVHDDRRLVQRIRVPSRGATKPRRQEMDNRSRWWQRSRAQALGPDGRASAPGEKADAYCSHHRALWHDSHPVSDLAHVFIAHPLSPPAILVFLNLFRCMSFLYRKCPILLVGGLFKRTPSGSNGPTRPESLDPTSLVRYRRP